MPLIRNYTKHPDSLKDTHYYYKVVWMDDDVCIVAVPKSRGYAGAEELALSFRRKEKGKTTEIKRLNRLK